MTRQPNRRERMEAILERDGPWCVWCSAPLDNSPGALNPPTTEHMVPRIKGGPSWVENELAACRRCNGERGHQSLAGFLTDCLGLGRTTRTTARRARGSPPCAHDGSAGGSSGFTLPSGLCGVPPGRESAPHGAVASWTGYKHSLILLGGRSG
ncbi:MAG: HNH endonuclease [Actinomycetota bacterium]